MTTNPPRGAVVVGVDHAPSDAPLDAPSRSALVLDAGIELARRERRPLHLVHAFEAIPWVYSPLSTYPPQLELTARLAEASRQVLERDRLEVLGRAPELEVSTQLSDEDPRQVLRDAGTDAAVLVVGARGRGRLEGLLLGSVSQWLTQHAPCPVLVVRPVPDHASRVVVGTDESAASTEAVEHAFAQASWRRLPLTVVHCVYSGFEGGYGIFDGLDEDLDDLPSERRWLAESVAGLREKYPDVEVSLELALGPPSRHLAAESATAALVVVGSHRRSLAGRLVHGAVSRAVAEHARCSVAVVPAGTA